MYLKHFLSGCSLYALLVFPAVAAEPLLPRAEIGFKGGTDRSLLTTEFWGPLSQKDDRVLYGDIRLMGDNDENREGNLGIGYRQIVQDYVLGGHAWIDRRRTQNNSTFHQLTFGVERLGHVVDMRANMYVPLNNSRNITTSSTGLTSLYLAGNGIYYDTNGFLVETPQYGLDGEIGYRIPIFQNKIDAVRIYGGGYHFFRNETENVTGLRIRTEAQINKAISIGARFQHDGPRGSQGFLEATLKFPFSAKKLYQTDYLRSRLDESPERDVDIVTQAKRVNGLVRQQVINSATGQQQRVLNVDNTNTNPGDGSKENPFNSLKAAEAVLQDNDIIYVNYGTGTTSGMDQGILIDKPGVSLIGSGSAFVYDSGRFTSALPSAPVNGTVIINASAAPIITNNQTAVPERLGNAVTITASNSYISGITVSGAKGSGITVLAEGTGQDISGTTIHNVTALNNGRRGILVHALNGGTIENVKIIDNTANNNPIRGIEIRSLGLNSRINDITIENNAANTNNNHGIHVYANSDASIENVNISNNQTLGNTGAGIYAYAFTNGTINNLLIDNNLASNNSNMGIYAYAQTNSQINNVLIKNNTASSNSQSGIRIETQNSQLTHALIQDNITHLNSRMGIMVYGNMAGSIAAEIRNNNVTNSSQNGIYIFTDGTASISSLISGNLITGNGTSSSTSKYYGINLNNDSSSLFNADLGGGTLGSIGGNRIYNNFYQDIFIDSMPGTGSTAGIQIKAQHNYWGNPSGLQVSLRTLEGTSTIDATNFLTH